MSAHYSNIERELNSAKCQLIAIADCLKGISKDDLTVAEKKIVDILIKAKIAEYSGAFNTVRLIS